ncbi:MAG: hypothetical protein M3040_00780 [Bacteroidota bacterium]|nr:hypothetical protein [Bacteroidota bacterium]
MPAAEHELSEKESLRLITEMIQKAKESYYETGISPLLWGSAVFIASFVTYLQQQFSFSLPFDIWLIVLFAIIPQIVINIRESKFRKFRSHTDIAVDAIWIVYAVTLFGLIIYQNIVPSVTVKLLNAEGWQMMKHTIINSKADETLLPFVPSVTSIFMLIYAFPTLATGIIKQFKPMILGAVITYVLFIGSCFVENKYDMLLSAITALVCWFIPGIILRKRYLEQKKGNV